MKTKSLLSDSIFYTIGIALNQGLRFLFLPILAQNMSPSDLGSFDSARNLILFGLPIIGLGLESSVAILFNDKDEKDRKKELITVATLITMISAIVFGITLYLSTDILYDLLLNAEGDKLIISLTILILFFSVVGTYLRNLLKWLFEKKKYIILLITESVIVLSLGTYFVVVKEKGVIGWMYALLVGVICLSILSFLFNIKNFSLKKISFKEAKKITKIGYPFAFIGAINNFIPFITRLLIVSVLGLASLGYYGVGERIGMLIMLFISGFSSAWGPFYLAKQYDEKAPILFGQITTIYIYVLSGVCFMLYLIGIDLLVLLTKEEYYEAHTVILPLSLFYSLLGLNLIASTGITISKKTYVFIWIGIISGFVAIIANWFLIPILGYTGGGWALFIGMFVNVLITFYFSQRFFRIQLEHKKIILILIVFIVSIVLKELIISHEIFSFKKLIIAFLFIISYVVTGWKINLFADSVIIKHFLGKR